MTSCLAAAGRKIIKEELGHGYCAAPHMSDIGRKSEEEHGSSVADGRLCFAKIM
jgi:hypothetical protein